ncbi:deoxyribose-phosphate aldolase [Caldalkalibacillus uzonensis]|uniref:Deoxyribose-phosphate aldolase n=1 Tax=Caldalkalibacillus uzonensis TaxID=353224 RepID=A0ABU0CUQ1_9BACI|nr:deoxyribose-phosphate aldolase [Caldalkalibacillus uzonensis]MDQ0339619.1 deoxyribose-phosphate aldolase [Caldalkalibacillus uzonensis]
MQANQLAAYIDHTLLKPEATQEQIDKLCEEARQYQFASVCVNPTWVKRCAEQLKGTNVKVCTVIGFPLGANTSVIKAAETAQAIADGAQEVDMVLNIGALKSGQHNVVEQDIKAVVEAAQGKALVKVIIETALLTDEEKIIACQLSQRAGADFVKTSTGFAGGGATVEDVQLMKKTVGETLEVKASGGIRDYEKAVAMIEAGATRLGASAGVAIVSGAKADSSGQY